TCGCITSRPAPRTGSITTNMSASRDCSPTFSLPPNQPGADQASTCRPAGRRPGGRTPASRGCRRRSRALGGHGDPGAGNTALLESLAGRPRQAGAIGRGVYGGHRTTLGTTVDARDAGLPLGLGAELAEPVRVAPARP